MYPLSPQIAMTTSTKSYRYYLPKKAVKSDCPDCGPRHRKTLSRYVNTQTGEPLPDSYGRCDRESNCGYHLSPYHKGPTGLSYAEQMNPRTQIPPIPKAWFRMASNLKRKGHLVRSSVVSQLIEMEGATPEQAERVAAFIYDKPTKAPVASPPVCTIPEEILQSSIGHYDRNQFAILLAQRYGKEKALELLQRFQIGTSSRWPGACVFWYIDERNRIRGGQIKLFDDTFHTAKYVDAKGETRSKTSWVHSALARKLDEVKQPYPDWLTAYLDEANAVEKSPCLFGLPQLQSVPVDRPIAIVEAPKTAVICTAHFPGFVWMAVGALSYLNAERLAPLRGRTIMLFPDLSKDGKAFARWTQVAQELQQTSYQISISSYLEENATDEEKARGLDLADYLLETIERDESDQRIVPTDRAILADPVPDIPTAYRIPKSLEYKWTLFGRPPLWWNKIATHKALMRCVIPVEEEPTVVQSIAEQLQQPGSTLRPDESQIERLYVESVATTDYPSDWDEPSPSNAVPTIKERRATDYFDWQRQSPPFNQLGLASLKP